MAVSTGTALLGSAVIGSIGARKAAKTQSAAADRAAALQYEASLPKNVRSLLGEFTYDDVTKQAEIALTPELEQIYRDRLARAAEQTARISAYDPSTYQQEFYEEQRALAAPGEERERLALENRLRAQGMLGATGGALRTQALLETQARKDLMRRAEARTAAQQQQTFMRGLESGDITAATQIAGLGGDLSNIGMGIGSTLGSAAGAGAARQFEAAQNLADSQAAFWSKIGGGVGDLLGGTRGASTVSPFTQGGYSGFVVTPPSGRGAYVPTTMQQTPYGSVPVPQQSLGLFGGSSIF